jgi:hypothetical protein
MGHLSVRELYEGNLEGGVFTGDPEGYSKFLEMGVYFHRGPIFWEHGGTLLS